MHTPVVDHKCTASGSDDSTHLETAPALAAIRPRSDSARFEPAAPVKTPGTVLRDMSIKAAQKDKGFTREHLLQLYGKGELDTTPAPTTLLSTVEAAMEDGEAGGTPTCLLHTDRHYVLRVELRYGEAETLPLPVEGVETMYILCDGHEDGDTELAVHMLEVCMLRWVFVAIDKLSRCFHRTSVRPRAGLGMQCSAPPGCLWGSSSMKCTWDFDSR